MLGYSGCVNPLFASVEDVPLILRPPLSGNADAPVTLRGPVSGATTDKLALDQALVEAYNANPMLAAATAQREVADAGVVQAKLRVNPAYTTELAPAEVTYRFFSINVTTQLGLKRQRRIEVADRLIDSTNATIRTTAWKIRQDTQLAYFELAVARQALVVMEDYVATTQRLLVVTQKRADARDASGLEVLRAEAAVADARAQLAPVQVRVQQAMRQLCLVLGRPPEQAIDIDPPRFLLLGKLAAKIPTFSSLIEQAQTSRPEFKQIAADLAVQASRVKLGHAQAWPDVQTAVGMSTVPQLTAKAAHNYFGGQPINKPFLIMTVPINVNDYGQGITSLARATARQLQQQRLALLNQVRQEVNLAYSNASAAEQQMDILFDESLPRQYKIVAMSENGYKQGALDLTGAITAQQTALSARLNFLQTATRYFQALVELERSVGRPIISSVVPAGQKP